MTDPVAPARRLFDAVTGLAAERGITLPERRFLAPSPLAAWDGEHFAVCLLQTLPGSSDASGRPGGLPARAAGSMSMPRAAFEARLVTCYPTLNDSGDAPAADRITAAAERLLAGLGLLLDAAYQFCATAPPGSVATVGQSNPVGPEGGLAGYTVPVTISPIA